jgi:hypothetical protein
MAARGHIRWHRRSRTLLLALGATSIPLWAACGSGGSGGAAGGTTQAKAPGALCDKVLAVLSDGPDPTADPVGYALSQILPLGDIHTTYRPVGQALADLVAADKALVKSNGSDHAAATSITRSDDRLNKSCPGVAP